MKLKIILSMAAAALVATAPAQTGRKISEWPVAGSITGTDVTLGNQGGATKQIPISLFDARYQPSDADLTAIAALTTTPYGRALLELANAAAGRTALGLATVAGTGAYADLTGTPSLAPVATSGSAADIAAGVLPIARGGTGTGTPALVAGTNISITGTWPNNTINSTASSAWADVTGKPTTLAGYGISDAITAAAVASGYQPLDSDLTAIAALTSTAYGRALLELANAAAGRTALGLVIGTDVQAYNATLAAVAGGTYTGSSSITTVGTIATGTVPWARLSGIPTTLSGHGITDGVSDTLQNVGDANTTITNGVTVAVVNATWTGGRTMTLPAASSYPAGRGFVWVDPAGLCNYRGVVFQRGGSDTIIQQDGGNTPGSGTSVTFPAGGYVYRWYSDGTSKWFTERNATAQFLGLTLGAIYNSGGGYTQIGDTNNYWRSTGASFLLQPAAIIKWNSAANLSTGSAATGLGRPADGVVETNNGTTAGTMGKLMTGWVVTAKTSNYSVVLADKGTFFTNTGASASVNFTLPTAQAGLQYSFYIDAAQTLTVTAGASTTIRIAGTASAAAGNITASTVGNSIRLMAISATQWVAENHEGTWTIN